MKLLTYFFSFIFLGFFPMAGYSQSFDDALAYYNDEQYEEAARLFAGFGDDRSRLFLGKSHLALAHYDSANVFLYEVYEQTNRQSIRDEALYSLALSHFRLKHFDKSLDYLYTVAQNNRRGLSRDARRFYSQILNYLSENQRFETLRKLESASVAIRYDLVRSSRPFLEQERYEELIHRFLEKVTDPADRQRMEEELLGTANLEPLQPRYPVAPEGTVYNIGVILPTFDENDPDFTIPRNLYFGMLLAADDFNSRNSDQKIHLVFKNSAEHPDSTADAFEAMYRDHRIDAVIGPLFSKPASRLASLADARKITMVAPLANSEQLSDGSGHIFQLNPLPEMHGSVMAGFAVERLQLNPVAIMLEEGMAGRVSAVAFREEARRLGASISHFIEQNFAVRGYDLSDVTGLFSSDSHEEATSGGRPSRGIYAPFTGQASSTMMNLLLNDLEAMRSNPVIMGTEEWKQVRLTTFQQQFFEIYYTESFGTTGDLQNREFFEQDYETRFGIQPDQFARVGYDTAAYLFRCLETAGNPDYLPEVMRNASIYNGLSMNIHFDGHQINQHLFIRPLTEKARERLDETGAE